MRRFITIWLLFIVVWAYGYKGDETIYSTEYVEVYALDGGVAAPSGGQEAIMGGGLGDSSTIMSPPPMW